MFKFKSGVGAGIFFLFLICLSMRAIANEQLEAVMHSQSMIWNAVAVENSRIFVAGPRWTGSRGPMLGLFDQNQKRGLEPYPNSEWNNWRPGIDNSQHFVNVNAIHRDKNNGLWVVDTGSPEFGGNPLPGGAKVVHISLVTNKIVRIYIFGPEVALPGSYIDDIRFHGEHAYLTDAGKPGLVVLNIKTGKARRVLENHPATTAPDDRKVMVDGRVLSAPNGEPLKVNADPLEVSVDGQYLYFAPLAGPWSKIETRFLDDASMSAAELAQHVQPWADLPPVGGTILDAQGNLYFTELATDSLKVRKNNGSITTIIQDKRLHWADAPCIDEQGYIWLPAAQIDRAALFQGGKSKIKWPITLYRYKL